MVLHDRVKVGEVRLITENEYYVRCSTPPDAHWKDAIEEDFHKRQKRR